MNKKVLRGMLATVPTAVLIGVMSAPALAADSPIPKPKPQLPRDLAQKLSTGIGFWIAIGLVAAMAGMVGVGIAMVVSWRRGELGEHMTALGSVAFGCIIIGAASSLALFFA